MKFELRDSLPVLARPTKWEHLVGNTSSLQALTGMLSSGKVTKSMFFSGFPGSGKTTTARLLAKVLNCENPDGINPCMKCESCLAADKEGGLAHPDISEHNMAQEGGKEKAKEVIMQAYQSPFFNTKVFIIDEAQTLSSAAMAALLKPTEEPPPHTVWLFCTTEIDKFPPATLGRFKKFNFSYPDTEDMATRLNDIVKKHYGALNAKRMARYTPMIADGCQCQPRESIQSLEMVMDAIAKSKPTPKEIKDIISRYAIISKVAHTNIANVVIKVVTGDMAGALDSLTFMKKEDTSQLLKLGYLYAVYGAHKLLGGNGVKGFEYKPLDREMYDDMLENIPATDTLPRTFLSLAGNILKATAFHRSSNVTQKQAMVSAISTISTR